MFFTDEQEELYEELKLVYAENERLRAAVALSVYELHFVADEHDCEQCREAAKNIMKIAKGSENTNG